MRRIDGPSLAIGLLMGLIFMVVVAATTQPSRSGTSPGQTEGGTWQIIVLQDQKGSSLNGYLLDTSTGETWRLDDKKRKLVTRDD